MEKCAFCAKKLSSDNIYLAIAEASISIAEIDQISFLCPSFSEIGCQAYNEEDRYRPASWFAW